jgi:hypothetical protein
LNPTIYGEALFTNEAKIGLLGARLSFFFNHVKKNEKNISKKYISNLFLLHRVWNKKKVALLSQRQGRLDYKA